MGRKSKTRQFHVLDGTARGEGKLKAKPAPATEMPRAPKWLGDYGKEFHRNYWDIVNEIGTYTVADRDNWFLGCQRYHRIREAEAQIDEYGLVVKGRGQELKCNPACAILKGELAQFRLFCISFGLDNEARQKYGVTFQKPSKMAGLID